MHMRSDLRLPSAGTRGDGGRHRQTRLVPPTHLSGLRAEKGWRPRMKCKNCKATKPATHSRAGTPLRDSQWYINTAGVIVCSPYCAGFIGGLDWKPSQQVHQ
jgi:hypothetical protein